MSDKKRLGKGSNFSVHLTPDLREKLDVLAKAKYRIPQSLAQAVRVMIENDYMEWEKEVSRGARKDL